MSESEIVTTVENDGDHSDADSDDELSPQSVSHAQTLLT